MVQKKIVIVNPGTFILATRNGQPTRLIRLNGNTWEYLERTCMDDSCLCETHDRWSIQDVDTDAAVLEILEFYRSRGFDPKFVSGTP